MGDPLLEEWLHAFAAQRQKEYAVQPGLPISPHCSYRLPHLTLYCALAELFQVASLGTIASERQIFTQQPLPPTATPKKYCDILGS